MYFYTTAPKRLDFPNTEEIEPRIATTGRDRVRLVDIEKSEVGDQQQVYTVHFYVSMTQEEFVMAVNLKVVEELLEPENYVFVYTDAPVVYDWNMYTIEVHSEIAWTRRKHEPVRLVLITKEGEPYQVGRYASGLFMALTPQHFKEELKKEVYGLVR